MATELSDGVMNPSLKFVCTIWMEDVRTELEQWVSQPSVKHASGAVDLVKIDAIMKKKKCHQIFIHRAIQFGKHLIGSYFIFLAWQWSQTHSRAVKNKIRQKKHRMEMLSVRGWPLQSPHLNIIELVRVVLCN